MCRRPMELRVPWRPPSPCPASIVFSVNETTRRCKGQTDGLDAVPSMLGKGVGMEMAAECVRGEIFLSINDDHNRKAMQRVAL